MKRTRFSVEQIVGMLKQAGVHSKIETRKLRTIENRAYTQSSGRAWCGGWFAGEKVKALGQELGIGTSSLYKWREIYRTEGVKGLRQGGRPRGSKTQRPAGSAEEIARRRFAALERKIGHQTLDIDFLQRAFNRPDIPTR